MKTRFIIGMMIAVIFVIIGVNLYNRDEDFTATKSIGLANIIFFSGLFLLGIFAMIKKAVTKK